MAGVACARVDVVGDLRLIDDLRLLDDFHLLDDLQQPGELLLRVREEMNNKQQLEIEGRSQHERVSKPRIPKPRPKVQQITGTYQLHEVRSDRDLHGDRDPRVWNEHGQMMRREKNTNKKRDHDMRCMKIEPKTRSQTAGI